MTDETMTRREPNRTRPRKGLRSLEAILWTLGVVCIGWVAWAWTDAALYQSRAAAAISSPAAPESAEAVLPSEHPPSDQAFPVTTAPGDPMGRLDVPALGIDAVVAHGADESTLRRAVGWISSTAPPGSRRGNVGLAGHRDSFFRHLGEVAVGDEVRLETPGRTSVYRVEWSRVVDPVDISVLAPTDAPSLTLVTCYPFHWVGPAPKRFVVRARRVDG